MSKLENKHTRKLKVHQGVLKDLENQLKVLNSKGITDGVDRLNEQIATTKKRIEHHKARLAE